jgi:hypothetical protein
MGSDGYFAAAIAPLIPAAILEPYKPEYLNPP